MRLRIEEYIPLRLRQLCKKHGYTKYRLSKLTGLSETALGNILSKASIPSIPTLDKICGAFGITLAQFFAGDGYRPDLTAMQEEILDVYDGLEAREREILTSFIRCLKR